ncbi:hypothetical protein LIS04_56 [Listeria phage LIS04]|nr:hypothetical protein LIS04_56 [Listeria phage LIS04]
MSRTRSDILEALFSIKSENPELGDKVAELLKLVYSNQSLDKVNSFIEEQTNSNYSSDFMSRMSTKKFYKTLKSCEESTDPVVVVKAISSLITHALIDIELGHSPRSRVFSDLKIHTLLEITRLYFVTGHLPDHTLKTIEELLD